LKRNILYISPNFNYACGVSKHVFTLLNSEELNKRFNLHFITNKGDALQKLENAGIRYTLIEFKTYKVFHFDFFRNLKLIKDYCKEKKIDIVHSHHRYPEYLSDFIKKRLNIKTVVTVHNFARGFRSLSYKSDKVIAISNSIKNYLIEYFNIPTDNIETLYNCLRNETIPSESKRNALNFNPELNGKKVLLYAGRLSKEKGIDILIDTFNDLTKTHQNVLLIIVCDEIEFLKKYQHRSEKIKVITPTDSLSEIYRLADLVVLPSYQEGLGYLMLEAGFFKIPFIGSRTGGIAEFIEDGVNGYLFDPGDAVDLARKIKYVLDHPKETSLAAEKLLQKVLQECNCDKYFRKLTDIYSTLLAHR
jgi:glycosyltransferase involved in cell wall biosynthesis